MSTHDRLRDIVDHRLRQVLVVGGRSVHGAPYLQVHKQPAVACKSYVNVSILDRVLVTTDARVGALASSPATSETIWDAARAQYNITAGGLNVSGSPAFDLWSPADALFFRDDSYLKV